jgi:hypothetical protein
MEQGLCAAFPRRRLDIKRFATVAHAVCFRRTVARRRRLSCCARLKESEVGKQAQLGELPVFPSTKFAVIVRGLRPLVVILCRVA